MSHHIDYSGIGWEAFEDLCVDLWFDEGYTSIRPYGRRNEGGRDAIFVDQHSKELTIFQFKRWTGNYRTSDLKSMIKEAAEKIIHFKPKRFMLNSAYDPNPEVNDWIPELEVLLGFAIAYWDRSWIDLRLDNRRQDLRRLFFGVNLEHHTWESLVVTSTKQVQQVLKGLSNKFSQELYVTRDAEKTFTEFAQSIEVGLVIVDRAGRGKTNTMCALSGSLCLKGKPAVLISGNITLTDDHGLERALATELGYGSLNNAVAYQACLQDASRALLGKGEKCYVFIDGVSEADDLRRMTRALKNLLTCLAELQCFRVCISCRDVIWPFIEYDLPTEKFLFPVRQLKWDKGIDKYTYQLLLGDFSDSELDAALPLYSTKYNVTFEPSTTAKAQLKHPLLLRLFCEANENQSLGHIDSVPVASTFEHYVHVKATAVAARTSRHLSPSASVNLLLQLAGRFWQAGDINSILESELGNITLALSAIGPQDIQELLHLLAEEGVVVFTEQPQTPERKLRIVFNELQDYLLLKYFLSRLPEQVRSNSSQVVTLLKHVSTNVNSPDNFKFLALIGTILPEVTERSEFMRLLFEWDLQTFGACLARIPPVGELKQCEDDYLQLLAKELRDWYSLVLATQFEVLCPFVDPWIYAAKRSVDSDLGIHMYVSPKCKEISYEYRSKEDPSTLVRVEHTQGYPTWFVSLSDGEKTVQLHDPDHGTFISIFRQGGPNGLTKRTLNFSFAPPFPGASLNVPERIALFDVWNELSNIIDASRLPYETVPLVAERARDIARSIQGLDPIEGLTLELLRPQMSKLLSRFPDGSRAYVETRNKLDDLEVLLSLLKTPLSTIDLATPDLTTANNADLPLHVQYSDNALQTYLSGVFSHSLASYKHVVERNFPKLAKALSVYAHFPCAAIVMTDRKSVRYALIPVDSDADPYIRVAVLPSPEFDLSDPKARFLVDNLPFKEFVSKELARLNRLHYPFHPIDSVVPIEDFFTSTPVNNFVKEWLKSDIREVLGF